MLDRISLRGTPAVLIGVAVLVTMVALVLGLGLLSEGTYDGWGALLVGPVLLLVSLPIFARQARREGERTIFWILTFALVLKLAGSVVRHYVAFDVYEGVADAAGYHGWGTRISENFRNGLFVTPLESLNGTDFMRFLTGLVYTITGPTRLGGFLVFSWLGFWGLYLFYRAFRMAVPEGRHKTYAKLLLFLPSLLYWPSSIGKESWMMFTLGVAAYGIARMLSGRGVRGAVWAGVGLWLAAIVRPHVAGLMGIALVAAYVVGRPRRELREMAPVVKGLTLVVVAVVAVILADKADAFLRESGIDTRGGVASTLGQVRERTAQGGSGFQPPILKSPRRAPVAVVTVLFRPLPMDAHNGQSWAAAIESTFLLGLSLLRWRWWASALRSMRDSPYVAFALVFAGLFVFAFSGVANFGLLARERVQLLPLYLVILSIRPRAVDRVRGGRTKVESLGSGAPTG